VRFARLGKWQQAGKVNEKLAFLKLSSTSEAFLAATARANRQRCEQLHLHDAAAGRQNDGEAGLAARLMTCNKTKQNETKQNETKQKTKQRK
jgi:lipase chaperone LimK